MYIEHRHTVVLIGTRTICMLSTVHFSSTVISYYLFDMISTKYKWIHLLVQFLGMYIFEIPRQRLDIIFNILHHSDYYIVIWS